MKSITRVKDLNPIQVEQNNYIISKLADVYQKWGYQQVSPPNVENIHSLTAGGGIETDEIIKIVADEPLGLRPEMTSCIARAASTRLAEKPRPLRLWASGTVFKSKRDNDGKIYIDENLTSGVELIGSMGMSIEVELLYLLIESLKALNLAEEVKPKLLISHTSLIHLLLSKFDKEKRVQIKEILTNFDLVGLKNLALCEEERHNLEIIQQLRGAPQKTIERLGKMYGENETLMELMRLFNIITPISEKYSIPIQFDPTFQPHYELYTGIVFQLICNTSSTPLVIARGGRYDELINSFSEKNNNSIGAGFSYSIDIIRKLIETTNAFASSNIERFLVAYGPNNKIEDALIVQAKLHQKGITALVELESCINEDYARKMLKLRGCNKLQWINN